MGEIVGLFDGSASGLPAQLTSKAALYEPATEKEAPVKHLAGYSPFVVFCENSGVPAGELATDVVKLLAFLRANIDDILGDPKLRDAATIFVGNVIVSMRPESHWRVMADGSREVGTRDMQITVDRLFDGLAEVDDAVVAGLVTRLGEWSTDEPDESALPELRPFPVVQAHEPYERPELPLPEYHEVDGHVVHYGNRWGADSPPEDSYSVETHVERFEGLHKVARALIDYLTRIYDVDVSLDPAHAMDVSTNTGEVIDVARVTPRDPLAAPLTFVWTSFPGVVVRAGVLHDFPFPICGCDACDETAESEASRLEELTLGVAAGGFGERYPVGRERWAEYALFAADGSGRRSGKGPRGSIPEKLAAAEEQLKAVQDGWRPWPPRKTRGARD
ncbi:DUF6226 family protein [Paenarthrobacter sp. NPDC090517]|uniref:DUF6226 family protein n=1 Tax=Paenarthrobacter sp. NPDC090517 TaxID=3364381 RepID=UPI00380A1B14